MLSHSEILELKRWNTPTIYNGWEQITRHNSNCDCFNLEEVRDYMPQMGPMAGYAVTLQIQPGNQEHKKGGLNAWSEYRKYIANMPGPKIVVVQDLDKPMVYGSFWGEVNSNVHKALGCDGVIVDGAIRDLDEMTNAGFKALARRLCVGHASCIPIRWQCEVEVFGCKVHPGQLIHADKHGFLAIPDEDQAGLLDAARFMDSNECKNMISAARSGHGKSLTEIQKEIDLSMQRFGDAAAKKFGSF